MLLFLLTSVCLGFNFNLKERRDNNIAQVKTIINNDTIQIVMGYFQSGNSILNEHNYTYNDSSNDIRGTVKIDEREYFIFKCSDSAGNFPNTKIFYVNGSKIILLSNFLSQFIVKEENSSIYDYVDHRDKLSNIRDQGSCGGCYSFGSLGALEGRLNIKYNLLLL